ncbi:MAG: flagellar basal body rod protein FlgF, partial [Methylobacter sp.]
AVQGADGKEAYTRAGDLRVTPEGSLQTGAGLPVLGQGGPITIQPAEKVTIGSDGTISVIPLGSGNATTQVEVGRIKLVKVGSENLEKSTDGLLRAKDGQPVAANADVRLAQGVLEGSNVNAISAMVDMIELARNFELQTKVMKSVDENSAVGAKLMQM